MVHAAQRGRVLEINWLISMWFMAVYVGAISRSTMYAGASQLSFQRASRIG